MQASGDDEGRLLAPFYTSYRAVVRAKVEGMELDEKEIPGQRAGRGPATRPGRTGWWRWTSWRNRCAVRPWCSSAGCRGAGNRRLAQALAKRADFDVLRSDVVRKELAGTPSTESGQERSARYLHRLVDRADLRANWPAARETILAAGGRVLIDASFRNDAQRHELFGLARRWGARTLMLECRAAPEVIRERLKQRRGDASDADWAVYQRAADEWQQPEPSSQRLMRVIDTTKASPGNIGDALVALRHFGLADGGPGYAVHFLEASAKYFG